MKHFMAWLESDFSPRMSKVNNNVWIVSLKDSVMQVLPFIFLGSLFAMLAILNDYVPWLPSFWVPYGWTMGMISVLISFLIPFNLMEKKRYRKQRLIAGMTGLVLFFMIISPQVVRDGVPGFTHSALGAGGMFVAILAGVLTAVVMSLFARFSFFSEDSVIPDFVRAWFDAMLPIGIIILAAWLAIDVAGLDLYNAVLSIFQPLGGVLETPWGFALTGFIVCFLYSMGISTWVLTPVVTPVLLAAMQANMDGTATNLVTGATMFSAYLWIGGVGVTAPLVVMMLFARAKRLKALARASVVPTVFNINEPIIFGAVAWNPILMVPLWIQGAVLPLVIWLFTKTIAFAPIPMYLFEMWYVPFPISTWLTTGSVAGLALFAIVAALATIIWYPFFRVYDRQVTQAEVETTHEERTVNV